MHNPKNILRSVKVQRSVYMKTFKDIKAMAANTSSFNYPLQLAQQTDGTWRMTVNNHQFNWVGNLVTAAVQMQCPYWGKLIKLVISCLSTDRISFLSSLVTKISKC